VKLAILLEIDFLNNGCWLKEKIIHEVGNDEFVLKALQPKKKLS
jgi:hypothetical protein